MDGHVDDMVTERLLTVARIIGRVGQGDERPPRLVRVRRSHWCAPEVHLPCMTQRRRTDHHWHLKHRGLVIIQQWSVERRIAAKDARNASERADEEGCVDRPDPEQHRFHAGAIASLIKGRHQDASWQAPRSVGKRKGLAFMTLSCAFQRTGRVTSVNIGRSEVPTQRGRPTQSATLHATADFA